ncbi:MAG: hypothetical protein VR68_05920 [Peptococcaceae bacterium BRH_c4a]|nr:MAG: hypothetical protein VR68_05920 [Peptococcaceae bacterium BRH_c4a]
MPVVFCGVCPHPPIMVPEVGKDQSDIVIKSRQAMLELGRRLKESGARSLVIISPHGPVFSDGIAINTNPVLRGNLKKFGAPGVAFILENDLPLASLINRYAAEAGVMTVELDDRAAGQYDVDLELDHGITAPLRFLAEAGVSMPMVPVYMGLLSYDQLYGFGAALQRAAQEYGRDVAVVASGDLSHCLTPDAPAGYQPRGEEFDLEMVRLLGLADVEGVIGLDSALVEKAGECGLRPIVMMLGALDGYRVDPEVLSYEGPFGVGYMVASLVPGPVDPKRRFLRGLEERRREESFQKKKEEGFLPGIARAALESHGRGEKFRVSPGEIPEEFKMSAGVFVSLKKKGRLRGCIGTVFPQQGNIIEETIHNAISAGHRDPRFHPVRDEELDDLDISVDVLRASEPVDGKEDLDPERYGVIVRSGRKQGLLLPNLEGVDTVEEQVDIARQKAGISPGEPLELERFEVVRYK